MELTGEYRIPATRQNVWDALNDPDVLKQCIDGCEELSKSSDTEFVAKVTAKVGPVRAKFSGKVMLSDLDPPNGYKISGEGQGGVAGFAKGSAKVVLTEDASHTILSYTADAEVGGKLASVGSRLVEGVAKKQADDFFGKFSVILGGTTEVTEDETENQNSAQVESAGLSISPMVWGSGLVVLAAILLYLIVA